MTKVGIKYFWECWGSDSNFKFYEDCILHSLNKKNKLPKFYLALHDEEIIGSYALLVNDIISRQDLMPWLACLYVNEKNRNNGIATQLLNHGIEQSKLLGFPKLYLSSDLTGFYEKRGWVVFSKGYGVGGDEFTIFSKTAS